MSVLRDGSFLGAVTFGKFSKGGGEKYLKNQQQQRKILCSEEVLKVVLIYMIT